MPLPTDPTWFKKFNAAIGNRDPKVQAKLAKKMQLTYRSGVGELIWAMMTTCTDLAFTSANCCRLILHLMSIITMGSSMLLSTCTALEMMVFISGGPVPDPSLRKVPYQQ